MPRRPSAITQADVARAIRAAIKTGAPRVEIRPDGTIVVIVPSKVGDDATPAVETERIVPL